jgi:putative membrane protein
MHYFGYNTFGWIGMILNLVVSIALIIGFVVLVVWAVRQLSGNAARTSSQAPAGQPAKDIAQARYARGEISREEYQQIISDLGS